MNGAVIFEDRDAVRDRMVDEHIGRAHALDRELKAIDPLLSLVWIKEGADEPGLMPARWHVKRSNPGTLDTYMPITGPGGQYREPDSAVADQLRARDLWRDDVQRALRKHKVDKAEALKRAELEARAAKKEEFATRVKAIQSPAINYDGDRKWKASLGDVKR